jgi:hypothetical protein
MSILIVPLFGIPSVICHILSFVLISMKQEISNIHMSLLTNLNVSAKEFLTEWAIRLISEASGSYSSMIELQHPSIQAQQNRVQ